MKNTLNSVWFAVLAFTGCIMFPTLALADCNNLFDNQEWNAGIAKVQKSIESKQFDEAIENAKPLYVICQDSPLLLYLTGSAFEQKGEVDRAKNYFRQASENTSRFVVEPGLARRIWFAHYETEYPERTEAAILEKDAKIEALTKEVTSIKETNTQLNYSAENAETETNARIGIFKTLMWSGVGFGIAGITLTAVGGGLVAAGFDEIDVKLSDFNQKTGKTKKEIGAKQSLAYGFIGAGLGMTVVGAVVAGIAGYQVSHLGKKDTSSDAVDVSFNVSPTSAVFNVIF